MESKDQGSALHSEIQPQLDVKHGDVALNLFVKGQELADPIDPAAEKRLLRKIDWMVIPFICITYLVTYIDKATIGYAAVFGLQKDLGLVGDQYSWLGMFSSWKDT